jgi:signal transduction histidine kinase
METEFAGMRANDLNLRELLRFDPAAGVLGLGGQRNLIFSQYAFAKLRRLLHDQLGHELARSMLTKFGYQNGAGDYRTLGQMFDFENDFERLSAGPIMHSWSGIVKVEPTQMEMDRARGHFHFKGIWRNSYEAEIHLSEFGLSPYPVCYTLTGYGSGWCSEFFGMPLLEIETKCVACGDPVCEWEIRPFRDWGPEALAWKNAMMGDQASISRQLEERRIEVERLNHDLESQVRARTEQNDRLLRVLCHDLKAPLAVLKHAITKCTDDSSDPRGALDVVERARLAIEEIIQHVQLSPKAGGQGGEALCLAEVPLEEIVQRSLGLFAMQLRDKSLTVRIDHQLPAGFRLIVDPAIFANNVLNNIISNAIKFSPKGGEIICSAQLAGDWIEWSIRDRGIGIPRDMVEKFNARREISSKRGLHGEAGSGQGLGLAREFVEAHGGQMQIRSRTVIESPCDHGTTVEIKLPRGKLRHATKNDPSIPLSIN